MTIVNFILTIVNYMIENFHTYEFVMVGLYLITGSVGFYFIWLLYNDRIRNKILSLRMREAKSCIKDLKKIYLNDFSDLLMIKKNEFVKDQNFNSGLSVDTKKYEISRQCDREYHHYRATLFEVMDEIKSLFRKFAINNHMEKKLESDFILYVDARYNETVNTFSMELTEKHFYDSIPTRLELEKSHLKLASQTEIVIKNFLWDCRNIGIKAKKRKGRKELNI